MSGFGTIVTGTDVRRNFETFLRQWTPMYLAEMDRLSGRAAGTLPTFRSWEPALRSPEKYNEDQLPACVIVAPGTIAEPVKRGGKWEVTWSVGIGCIVSGQDRDNTLELAELYSAAVRTAVLQHRSLNGFAIDCYWIAERYDDLIDADLRTMAAGVVQFGVVVGAAVDSVAGPVEPPAPEADPTVPVPDPVTVETVEIEVEHLEVGA